MPIMYVILLLPFSNMYDYGIDDVSFFFLLEGITKCDLA